MQRCLHVLIAVGMLRYTYVQALSIRKCTRLGKYRFVLYGQRFQRFPIEFEYCTRTVNPIQFRHPRGPPPLSRSCPPFRRRRDLVLLSSAVYSYSSSKSLTRHGITPALFEKHRGYEDGVCIYDGERRKKRG